MTGEGQSIVNRFKEAVEAAKIEAKDAAGTVGSDFAEIMGVVDGYVAAVPKRLSKAEMRLSKVGAFFGAILRRVEDLFQMLDNPRGVFSAIRMIAILSSVVAAIEVLRGNDLRALGCGVVVGITVLAISFEESSYAKSKKVSQVIQPQIAGLPSEGIVNYDEKTAIPGKFMGKEGN